MRGADARTAAARGHHRERGLENKQTARIYRTALRGAVANDRIARRYSELAECLTDAIAWRAFKRSVVDQC